MIWFAVVVAVYLVLSPVACLLIGRAIRVREVERPVEVAPPAPEPVAVVAAEPAPLPAPAPVDLRSIRAFTGRTPRALRPRWQQGALRTLGL